MMRPRVIDLFCGAGGLSHGFQQAGFQVVAGIDHDRDSLKTFELNHVHGVSIYADIDKLDPSSLGNKFNTKPGELECLIGGPPCQGFSKNRAFRHQNGMFVDDPRNEMYRYFFSFVDYFKPKVVVIENVPEILIKKGSEYKDAVLELFEGLGYHVSYAILNAAEYGVPQLRKRAFFVAGREKQRVHLPTAITASGPRPGRRTPNSVEKIVSGKQRKNGLTVNLELFALPEGPTVWGAIGDLHKSYANSLDGESLYGSEPFSEYQSLMRGEQEKVKNHFPWPLSQRQLCRIMLLSEGQSQLHLPVELQTKDGYGSAYRRMQSDAQALTITTWMFHPGSGMFTHPFDNRVLTIREAARIQSFGDDFVFFGRYHSQCRQVGNAVAPLVAYNIAKSIKSVLT